MSEMTTISFSLPEDLKERLDEYHSQKAKELCHKLSRSAVLVGLLERAMKIEEGKK